MTMHLVRGMTSLNTKNRKVNRKPGWEKAQAKHDKWLRKMNAHPDQIKKVRKEFKEYAPIKPYSRPTESYPSLQTSDRICAIAPRKETPKYTGTLIRGIAVMHKSNMVPITSNKDAKEIARMRRG